MEISNHLTEFINAAIETVIEKKVAISIEIAPDHENINIEPWEPFHYYCPYKEKS